MFKIGSKKTKTLKFFKKFCTSMEAVIALDDVKDGLPSGIVMKYRNIIKDDRRFVAEYVICSDEKKVYHVIPSGWTRRSRK